jgi:hypothetical protein
VERGKKGISVPLFSGRARAPAPSRFIVRWPEPGSPTHLEEGETRGFCSPLPICLFPPGPSPFVCSREAAGASAPSIPTLARQPGKSFSPHPLSP